MKFSAKCQPVAYLGVRQGNCVNIPYVIDYYTPVADLVDILQCPSGCQFVMSIYFASN